MTEKRFKFLDGYSLRYTCIIDRMKIEECDVHKILKQEELLDLLNAQYEEIEELRNRLRKFQSKYDKSKTDEVKLKND